MNSEIEIPAPAKSPTGDPYLLTPGPLTTSETVKQAMLHDYGSRDTWFIELNQRVLSRLVGIVNGEDTHVAVPLQGSGTFVVEAMIGCFVPGDGKLLICINGAYGKRIAKICDYLGRNYTVLEFAEDTPVDCELLGSTLASQGDITHVVAVYCETTSGILNPLEKMADVTKQHGCGFLIDAMSAFGAMPLDSREVTFDAVVASSNKCLEGAPGMGFCIASKDALVRTEGNSHSLSMDLYDQWKAMEANQQWRFTPPTHVLLAFDQALNEFDQEGGVPGRGGRYRNNCDILVSGMREMGFRTLLDDDLQAPIIVTFHMPESGNFVFDEFYDQLRQRGFVIYPGKLTIADSFRIGCIGRLGETEMRAAIEAVRETILSMGVAIPVS